MKLGFGKSWTKTLERNIEGYEFEVGVLEDKEHLEPVDQGLYQPPQIRTYAGGPVRKTSRKSSGVTTGDVLVENMERLNTNLLLEPFQKQSSEIMQFTREFLKSAIGKGSPNRVRNLLQAIVRNPILEQKYGNNSAGTADAKGFDRHLFDTGQMFKAITARVLKRGR